MERIRCATVAAYAMRLYNGRIQRCKHYLSLSLSDVRVQESRGFVLSEFEDEFSVHFFGSIEPHHSARV